MNNSMKRVNMHAASNGLLSEAELAAEMAIEVWQRVEPPLWWDAIEDYIVADGVIGDLRGHMVAGQVEGIRVVRNAYIVGQADWPGAVYSDRPSHLTRCAAEPSKMDADDAR